VQNESATIVQRVWNYCHVLRDCRVPSNSPTPVPSNPATLGMRVG
jgi:hypothetical protein